MSDQSEMDAVAGPLAKLIAQLTKRRFTIAVAESLTGGLVLAALTSVPGASKVVRGGVVAYASDVKRDVLDVDGDLLSTEGAVNAAVAEQMARAVRLELNAHFVLATTGVAGPDPQDGVAPGVVFVAVDAPFGHWYRELLLTGDRTEIREQTSSALMELFEDVLSAMPH